MILINILFYPLIFFTSPIEEQSKAHFGLIVDENVSEETVNLAITGLEEYYNADVNIVKKSIILTEQYKNDTINAMKLSNHLHDELQLPLYTKTIFLTNKGIRLIDNSKYTVRGVSKLNGKFGVVSTLVVKHESTSNAQYEFLLTKVLIHEMGHLLGLEHCSDNEKCILVASLPDQKNFYNSKNELCEFCITKIDMNLIRKKYRKQTP